MKPKRKALSPAQAAQWSQMAHALYLEALMTQTGWSAGEFAFHGGTSLRLSWHSARHSEDLDFLLSRKIGDLAGMARKTGAALAEMARRVDANFVITLQDRTKDAARIAAYLITVSHPDYIGTAKIKAEFWRTKPAYLQKYPTQLRTPAARDTALDFYSLVSHPVPAATLETAYADKLVAFATRPYLKWRDLYDLWWIGTQTTARLDINALCKQFLHNISAYTLLQNLPPAKALALFLKHGKQDLVKMADPGIKTWLPASLWARIHPDGIGEIVDYVLYAIDSVAAHLEHGDRGTVNLNALPPPAPKLAVRPAARRPARPAATADARQVTRTQSDSPLA